MRDKILSLFLILFLTGCSSLGTYNAATGRSELIFIPTSEEVTMGRDVHGNIIRQYELSSQTEKIERIEKIGQRLAQISDRQDYQYHFYLIEKEEMNAFTTPGGNIYLNTGLVDKLKTDDQIAAVVAHEIGHCAARHTIKKFQAALGYNLIGNIIINQVEMGDQVKGMASLGSNALMTLVFSSYGRKDEYEADRLGVKYMQLAGYDLQAMVETLTILKKESKGAKTPLILRSHPYLDDRVQAVKEMIAQTNKQRDIL